MKMIKEAIEQALRQAQGKLKLSEAKFVVEHPKDESHGDYSSNVAMVVSKQVGKSPREVAERIVGELSKNTELAGVVERIEVAGPGFINFTMMQSELWQKAKQVGEGRGELPLKGKKIMVEYTDPNPFKEFHIGHLMSNTIGEAIARLAEAQGGLVKRANYQGDVGLHVAKSVWGMQQKMAEEGIELGAMKGWNLNKRQRFLGQAYARGASKYEEDEKAKKEMNALNKVIYEQSDSEVMELYRAGREWSLMYFETIYQRLGTEFDEYFFESEAGKVGLEVVQEGLDKGVLEEGEGGAVVYKGEKDGLHTRVFRNALGLPTYEAKDLGLAKTKYGRFEYDESFIVTADEITEYFRVVLKVMEQLYPDLWKKTTHMPHGMMKLTTGKMSSRTGKVVTGEGLLDELKAVVLDKMGERKVENKQEVADIVAVGALKWTVLKQQMGGDIVYEPGKMTSLEGDTGPYVQYTAARAQSVLRKFLALNSKSQRNSKSQIQNLKLNTEELNVVRWLGRYPEVVKEAGSKFAPHMVAGYLYELAARFNTFYNKHQIVGSKEEGQRLEMTGAVAAVLKRGLGILGIEAPNSM